MSSTEQTTEPSRFQLMGQYYWDKINPALEAENWPEVERLIGVAQNSLVDVLNAKYFVVNENGKPTIFSPKRDEMLKRRRMDRFTEDGLKLLYRSLQVPVSCDKEKKKIEWTSGVAFWLAHSRRKTFAEGAVFHPRKKAPDGCFNWWDGYGVPARTGDWSLLRQHILEIICDKNRSYYEYLIKWCALLVQHPEWRGHVAIVLKGKKGIGKGVFVDALLTIMGQHGFQISNSHHLTGKFNLHLMDCCLLYADEAYFAGDKKHEGVLKAHITEKWLAVEPKGREVFLAPNYLHVIMSSNNEWVVPTSWDERRYFVLEVSDARMGNLDYFAALIHQLDNGGYEAMLEDLLHMDLAGFNVRDFPKTLALQDQQIRSQTGAQRWWYETLWRGSVKQLDTMERVINTKWEDWMSTADLHRSYQRHCQEVRDYHPLSETQFGIELTRVLKLKGKRSSKGERPHGYELGSLEEARRHFVATFKLQSHDWPDMSEEPDDVLQEMAAEYVESAMPRDPDAPTIH